MFFSPASTVTGQIAAGKLVALATAVTIRATALPIVPSNAESWRLPGHRKRRLIKLHKRQTRLFECEARRVSHVNTLQVRAQHPQP